MTNNRKNSIRKAHAPVPTTQVSYHFLQYSILRQCIKKYKSDIQIKSKCFVQGTYSFREVKKKMKWISVT